ncbi:MAG: hypothetical protein LBH04_10595 [Tannerellaceae bacterium]|nr:hypothetical protein [Tannerellaceae bacterium]
MLRRQQVDVIISASERIVEGERSAWFNSRWANYCQSRRGEESVNDQILCILDRTMRKAGKIKTKKTMENEVE